MSTIEWKNSERAPMDITKGMVEPRSLQQMTQMNDARYFLDQRKHSASDLRAGRLYQAVVDIDGDGDYTSLNDAIDAGETRILVRAGDYTLSADLSVSANTTIRGESVEETKIDTSGYNIKLDNNNITLENLWVHGDSDLIDSVTGDYVRVKDCKLIADTTTTTNYNDSIRGISGDYFKMSGCTLESTNQLLEISGDNSIVRGNTFLGYQTSNFQGGGSIQISGDSNMFTNNHFERIQSGNYNQGIECSGNRNTICNNNIISAGTDVFGLIASGVDARITGNTFEGWDIAIRLSSDYRQTCNNNSIYNSGGHGIEAISGSNTGYGYKTVSNNIVYSAGESGIHLWYGNRTIVNGNAIYNAGDHGIATMDSANASRCIITNNEVSECGDDGIMVCGGDANHDGNHMVITGNHCNNNVGHEAYLRVQDSVVVANDFSGDSDITDVGASQIAHNS